MASDRVGGKVADPLCQGFAGACQHRGLRNQSKPEFPRAVSCENILAEGVVAAACGHQRALMCQMEGRTWRLQGGR